MKLCKIFFPVQSSKRKQTITAPNHLFVLPSIFPIPFSTHASSFERISTNNETILSVELSIARLQLLIQEAKMIITQMSLLVFSPYLD